MDQCCGSASLDADPDPACHLDPDPSFPLKKCSNRLIFHTFWLVIWKLMRIRIRIRIQLITLMRMQIRILLITLKRIWVLPFNLMRIRIHSTDMDNTKIRSLDSFVNGNMQSIVRSYISYLQLPRSLHLSPTIHPYSQSWNNFSFSHFISFLFTIILALVQGIAVIMCKILSHLEFYCCIKAGSWFLCCPQVFNHIMVAHPRPRAVFRQIGSVSQMYGSGSFHHQAKIRRKPLISTVLWLIYDFLFVKNDVNKPKNSEFTTLFNSQNTYQFVMMVHDDQGMLVPHVLEQVCKKITFQFYRTNY